MKISTQKLIDHWLGLPLCWLASPWVVLARLLRRGGGEPRTILVTKFFGIGSLILQAPLLASLRRRYPRARLIAMTFAGNRWVLQKYGFCDEIITVDPKGWWSFARDTIRAVLRLAFRVDMAIDLEYLSKYTTLMTSLAFAPRAIGIYAPLLWRRLLYSDLVYFNPAKHVLDIYRMVAARAGSEAEYPAGILPLPPPAAGRQEAERALASAGIPPGTALAGINVNASDLALGRRWPRERFAGLIERLAADWDGIILLTGAPGEDAYTRSVYAMLSAPARDRSRCLTTQLSLEGFIGLLGVVDLFITNDSGPLHIAWAAGAPTLSLWGPGDPSMYGARGAGHRAVYHAFPCSPCMYIYRTQAGRFCNFEYPCMAAITVEETVRAALERLGAARGGKAVPGAASGREVS